MLCQSQDGKPPGQENLEEAFEAVDKLFTQLSPRGKNMPHSHIFPLNIYFIMANYLGHSEKARVILQIASQKTGSELYNFVDVPTAYELLKVLATIDEPAINILSLAQLEEMGNTLRAALDTRAEYGWRKPLSVLPVAELLSRFTKAAFFVYRDEYIQNNINTPEDILYMPITAERISELETKLGPLPADIKEIALIADGFCGGWHFAGGGWPGIENLSKVSSIDYETYLGYQPEPERRVETKTRPDGSPYQAIMNVHKYGVQSEYEERGWGNILVGTPDKECNLFEHVLCPPSVWAKYQAHKGIQVSNGEYAYLYFATWTGGVRYIQVCRNRLLP